MMPITELLLGGSMRTMKSGVLIQNIDRAEFDAWGKLRIRGYVQPNWLSDYRYERWTILDPSDIDLSAQEKIKMEQLVYLVTDENNLLQWICESEDFAKNYITLHGNENWKIDSEEMC